MIRSNNFASSATAPKPISGAQSFNVLDRLAKKLLQWDFLSDWKSDSRDRNAEFSFRSLPDAFTSSQQYIETWEPLMIREFQQNIIADIRSNWNANKKANTSLLGIDPKSEGEYLVRIDTRALRPEDQSTEGTPISMDVVLISLSEESLVLKKDNRISQRSQDNDFSLSSAINNDSSNISGSYLALVTTNTLKNGNNCSEWLLLTKDWQNLCTAAKHLQQQVGQKGPRNSTTQSKVPISAKYRILTNIRSSWREYFALMEVQRLPLKSFIFGTEFAAKSLLEKKHLDEMNFSNYQNLPIWERVPLSMLRQTSGGSMDSTVVFAGRENIRHSFDLTLEKELASHWKASKMFMTHLKSTFNPSQLCAMHNAITSRGISLIQGPPGTGKTKTIVGLLNGIHLHEHNVYYDELLRLFMDPQQKHLVMLHDLMPRHYIEVLSRAVGSKPRILVVAPSNVAVDHIMERVIAGGFQDGHGNTYHPRILRLDSATRRGKQQRNTEDIHPIESVTLDHLLQEEINPSFLAASERRQKFDELTLFLQQCLVEVRNYHALLINVKHNFEICQPLPEGWELRVNIEDGRPFWVDHKHRTTTPEPPVHLRDTATTFGYRRFDQLPDYSKYAHLFTQALTRLETLNIKKARLEAVMTSLAMNQRKDKNLHHHHDNSPSHLSVETKEMIETSLISETQIMFTTLNMCGHSSLEASEFTVAVIDEAAQCVEPAILIPLRRGCKKCVLVGDQDQLPATIFATEVQRFGYSRSLFQRLIEAGHPYVMLDTQYRMRPEISRFPSLMFYDGLLQDGSSVTSLDSYCLPNIRRNCLSPQSTYFTPEERARYFPASASIQTTNETSSSAGSSSLLIPTQSTTSTAPAVYSLLSMKANDEQNSNSKSIIDGAEVVTTLPVVSSPQWFLPYIDRDYYPIFNTLMFFDLQYSSENAQSNRNNMSRMNLDEAVFCIHLIETLILDMQLLRDTIAARNGPFNSTEEEDSLFLGSIGVITPYSEQLSELRRQVQQSPIIRKFRMFRNIELNTVDGFQGREKDIIIISTVRANDEGDIGFVSNKQRMNVAITRAKYALFVVGNAQTLSHHGLWYSYIHYCRSLNAVVTVPERFFISEKNDGNNINDNIDRDNIEYGQNQGQRGKKRRRQDYESNLSYAQYASHGVHERSQLVSLLHSHLSTFQREHGVKIPEDYVLYSQAASSRNSRYRY